MSKTKKSCAMKKIGLTILVGIQLMMISSCYNNTNLTAMKDSEENFKIQKDDSVWEQELTKMQYFVLREKGTEHPFTGIYDRHYKTGTYHCAACDQKLFSSESKYNSGCGWPAFHSPFDNDNVVKKLDTSHSMIRTEVLCSQCGGHLGHIFNDGPPPTGQRYCINSAALVFKKKD